jgi:predicted Zn-dependent protease
MMFDLIRLAAALAIHGALDDACSGCDHRLPARVLAAIHRVDEQQAQPTRSAAHQADLDEDVRMGKEYAKEVEKELKLSENQDMINRVNKLGAALTPIANGTKVEVSWGDPRLNPFDYTFKVVKGDDVNAFSIPGGFIYVYEGLIKYAESDDELAGVLAHEIAHAAFRHLATLRREQSRLSAITLPLIFISIFSNSDAAQGLGAVGQLLGTAIGSGWSQKAEESADWGGFQYMLKSPFNPVGLLTFMERLAYDERNKPRIEWGIYRTHPPSRQRAIALRQRLERAGLPIRRSTVTSTLRADVRPGEDGHVEVWFAGSKLVSFGGADALSRADAAAAGFNVFFDHVPKLFEIRRDGSVIVGKGRPLLTLEGADVRRPDQTVEDLAEETVRIIKRAIYDLQYRVWEAF